MNNLSVFSYNGQVIGRRSNGFVNLTQMCQANGKRLDVFMKAQKTKEYIECLERSHQMVVTEVVQGGEPDLQGTWGHPSLAINLARWISPEFAVWCDGHIFNLLSTGSTSIKGSNQQSPEWTKARSLGKGKRRNLTDSVKGYIERHPELTEGQRKFLYSNVSDSLNVGIFDKRSNELKALMGLKKSSALRDNLSSDELSTLLAIEFLASQIIENEDLDPCAAVKKAIESSYSSRIFAEKYLNGNTPLLG